jgi:hypothetical protein
VLEDVRVHGWNVELRLRIPLFVAIRSDHQQARSSRDARASRVYDAIIPPRSSAYPG